MNFLGKVFVVLILIMSIVFMSLAMVVYATHKNWKAEADLRQTQLTQLQAKNNQLEDQHNRREEELDIEIKSAQQQVSKLETERVALIDNNAKSQAELEQLKAERGTATAAVAATQQNNEQLSSEVTGLRDQIRNEQQKRDQAFATTLSATEELHQVTNDYESAKERQQQLTEQVAGMSSVMRESGLDPATEPDSVVPTVDGLVSQVRRSGGALLVEVTIGADDGLKPGNTLEVYRGDRYLGRLEVLRTAPDKAVGRVDRRFEQGLIQEGDRVATRLRVG